MIPIIVIETEVEASNDASFIERLRAALVREKGMHAAMRAAYDGRGDVLREYWQRIQGMDKEIVQLKHQVTILRDGNEMQAELLRFQDQVDELGRRNTDLAARAEQADQLEAQLEAADRRIDELEAALAIAQLPAESRDNVINLVRRAA
ncbi:hypothetical protein [Paludibacterium purpuratum]|uniref:Uncharacterized protein n=1 Tax=Paludibacterium purpuratum TaxID=1144873 RepID=A0A4R7BB93_9NEIS|nr:hypothetical protein [Paludibacterium purpuratum]TDR82168.1 hypothetical protein DFP86_102282 [Paludibacterium purpuratum]